MINLILLLISVLIFGGYVFYIYKTYGVLTSVSDSVYHLPNKWLFSVIMMIFPIPLIIVGINVCPENLQFLPFLAGGFITFVGAAPCIIKEEMEVKVHVIGATGGVILETLFLIFALHIWYFGVILILFTLYSTSKLNKFPLYVKNHTWWIEILAFILMVLALLIKSI